MRVTGALPLIFGFAFALLGLALRLAVPVAPVDDAYRAVMEGYRAAERARDSGTDAGKGAGGDGLGAGNLGASNRPETRVP